MCGEACTPSCHALLLITRVMYCTAGRQHADGTSHTENTLHRASQTNIALLCWITIGELVSMAMNAGSLHPRQQRTEGRADGAHVGHDQHGHMWGTTSMVTCGAPPAWSHVGRGQHGHMWGATSMVTCGVQPAWLHVGRNQHGHMWGATSMVTCGARPAWSHVVYRYTNC